MATNNSAGGGNGGRRPFFNDRRITIAGPQRLRQNVQDLLAQFNRQFVTDNPHLLHELTDQLSRLQELLSTNNTNRTDNTQRNQQNGNIPGPVVTHFPAAGLRRVRHPASVEGGPSVESSSQASGSGYQNNSHGLVDSEIQLTTDMNGGVEEVEISRGNQFNGIPREDSIMLNMDLDIEANLHTLESPATDGLEAGAAAQVPQAEQNAAPDAALNADADLQRLMATLRAPEMQDILRVVISFVPFFLLLLAKWVFTYAASIIMLVCLVGTFFLAGTVLESSISSYGINQTPKWRLVSALLLIGMNVGGLYGFFSSEKLYMALLLQPTEPLLREYATGVSFLELLWLITATDLVAKFMVMVIKGLVVLSGTAFIANHRRKARAYQWLEYTSHMYRYWLPATPWSYYLVAGVTGGYIYSFVCKSLFVVYILLKAKFFKPKIRRWWTSTISLLRPITFGRVPASKDLLATGPTCSICYCEFTSPIQLICKHIFCEECVTTWLDKQKTCPMCRTPVVTDNDWKDGKTSYCLQLI